MIWNAKWQQSSSKLGHSPWINQMDTAKHGTWFYSLTINDNHDMFKSVEQAQGKQKIPVNHSPLISWNTIRHTICNSLSRKKYICICQKILEWYTISNWMDHWMQCKWICLRWFTDTISRCNFRHNFVPAYNKNFRFFGKFFQLFVLDFAYKYANCDSAILISVLNMRLFFRPLLNGCKQLSIAPCWSGGEMALWHGWLFHT